MHFISHTCIIIVLTAIDFDEFLQMYKRLFVLCKSVVSQDVAEITMNSPRRLPDVPSKIPGLKKVSYSYHVYIVLC